jgi:hypothetical protein
MEKGAEGAVILAGALHGIDRPVTAFVRLEESLALPNAIEVNLPVRFLVLLLCPASDRSMDPHEVEK